MNKHLLRLTGLASLVLLLQASGFAQNSDDKADKDTSVNHLRSYDEIVIKHKGDKDAKVTIEIKNGEVLINGKPASDYQSDDISVRKRKIKVMDGRTFSFSGPDGDMAELPFDMGDGPGSPFRNGGGVWNFDGPKPAPNQAFLGISSRRQPDGPEGALVTGVSDSSGAAKAGLKIGDLITKVDEMPIDGPEALSDAVHKYKPQDKVTLTFTRDGKEQKATATLGKARKLPVKAFRYKAAPELKEFYFKGMPPMPPMEGFGLNDFKAHQRLGIRAQDTEDGKGVKVLSVDDDSPADKAGIKEGDIITRFDGKEINSAPGLVEEAQASKSKPSVHITVLRNGKTLDLEVKTPKKLKTADL